MTQTKPRVDPAIERPFRRGYLKGWLGATRAWQKLLEGHELAPEDAAQVLKEHHAEALARWADRERDDVLLYPPQVSKSAGQNGGDV